MSDIRNPSTDASEINDRLNDEDDTFPYVKSTYATDDTDDIDEVLANERFDTLDMNMCRLMYTGIDLHEQVVMLSKYRKDTCNGPYGEMHKSIGVHLHGSMCVTALEAASEVDAAMSKIYIKISEYIMNIHKTLKMWIPSMQDIQTRSINAIKNNNLTYMKRFDINKNKFSALSIDLGNGGCPASTDLKEVCSQVLHLIRAIDSTEKSSVTKSFTDKMIVYLKKVVASTETESSTDTEDGTTIFNNLPSLQTLFDKVGIKFDGTEAASFTNILAIRQDTVADLGYDKGTFEELINDHLPNAAAIGRCLSILPLLEQLNSIFVQTNIPTKLAEDAAKYSELLQTIPSILTLLVSIYRSTIVAARYYTVTTLDILVAINKNIESVK